MIEYQLIEGTPSNEIIQEIADLELEIFSTDSHNFDQLQYEFHNKSKLLTLIARETGNEYRGMLILNIKNGFDIIGTFLNRKGKTRITLEKKF
ncbi:MAG: hypothetical protein ACPGJV_13635 [Bacteriovoracaceae bacterium]